MYTLSILRVGLIRLVTCAASGAAYKGWTDEFTRQEISEAWENRDAPLRAPLPQITIAELRAVPAETLAVIGFAKWNADLRLIPLWAFHLIKDGEELVDIFGETSVKGKHNIDLDVRGGCLAYGFRL